MASTLKIGALGEAVFSEDELHRFTLERVWGAEPRVAFLCLNPSTATHDRNDPTITRCIGFAKAWGYGALTILNICSIRATDPHEMLAAAEPNSWLNDHWISIRSAGVPVVCAWGSHGDKLTDRVAAAMLAARSRGGRPHVMRFKNGDLALTASGQPRHPLYLPGGMEHAPWQTR